MKKEKRDIKFEVRFSKSEMERIEKIAKKINMPKSTLIRNLALNGLEDAELLHKLGFFKIAEIIQRIQNEALNKEKQLKELATN